MVHCAGEGDLPHCDQGSWPSLRNVCRPPALHIGRLANIAVRKPGPLCNVCRPPPLHIVSEDYISRLDLMSI